MVAEAGGREDALEALQRMRQELRARLPELRARYGVRSLALFGSRVRGDAGPESDVDVLVDFDTPPGLIRLGRLEAELEAILGHRVDLALASTLRPEVRTRLRREKVDV